VRAHADPHLTCILVGNKSDLASERRQVLIEEGEQWARDEGLLFVEASAKSGANVEAAFEAAARDILAKIRRGVFDDDRVRLVLLSSLSVVCLSLGARSCQYCCCIRPSPPV
jgi:Ras-related protein Rab-2A